jgi:hypothetical protein
VHVVVNHKYLGHLIVVVYFASTLAAGLLGITDACSSTARIRAGSGPT